jgi:hypothetical protein
MDSPRQERLKAECRARSAKRHARLRRKAGKLAWRHTSKRDKWLIIKNLKKVNPHNAKRDESPMEVGVRAEDT